jgi:hypothetical protein
MFRLSIPLVNNAAFWKEIPFFKMDRVNVSKTFPFALRSNRKERQEAANPLHLEQCRWTSICFLLLVLFDITCQYRGKLVSKVPNFGETAVPI